MTPPVTHPQLPQRIVVGLDEQGRADAAFATALELSTALDARLEIVHALPVMPEAWPGLSALASMERTEKLSASSRAAALAHVRRLLERNPGAPFQPDELLRVVEGNPARVLLAEARSSSDLVMLGANRKTGVLQFGGTLRTLLARSAGPLWLQPQPSASLQRILVPIDMSEHSLHALGLAVEFASRLQARVHVLHAFLPPNPPGTNWPEAALWESTLSPNEVRADVRTKFEQALMGFDWRGVAHEESLLEGDPVEVILEQAAEHDLIAMGTHGRSGLTAVVLGSVTWRVIERSAKPLLVTRLHGHEFAA